MVTKVQIRQWLETAAEVLEENKSTLDELDAALGDGDHGTHMERGFKTVMRQMPSVADKDIGNILETAGTALISSVGGASGPLYGTFFIQAGVASGAKHKLTAQDLSELFQAGVAGVMQRGKATPGDKTMVDALAPAAEAFHQALTERVDTVDVVTSDNAAANTDGIIEALELAVAAAKEGMQNTVSMLALKGRASQLGERSIGHQDPGATSSYLILKALLDTLTCKTNRQIE
jgi:dihydroxyacetone kinase-like protein